MLRLLYLLFLSTLCLVVFSQSSFAATTVPFTVNMSEAVNVTGTPRIAVNVGGVTRYATYASGTGTSALTFNYAMVAGDVDLDGVALTSPIDLNGGTLKDLNGNDATLTFTVPNTSNVKINYPSLGMDFVADSDGQYTLNGTTYSTLPSLLTATGGTFTRASVGTYFDSAGVLQTATSGTPRFDYDPVTHAAKGILIEEGRTNLLPRSREFDAALWLGAGLPNPFAVTANIAMAPDNTLTAEKASPNGTNPVRRQLISSLTNGAIYTASVYVRAPSVAAATSFRITTNNAAAWGTGGSTKVTLTSSWQRVSVTWTQTGSTNAYVYVGAVDTTSANDPTCYGDVEIWGAQLEQGSFPTSYIPTTTAAVTRQADIVNIPTGTWYNQSAGTFMNEVSWASSSGTNYPMFFRVDDATNNERWNAFYNQSGNSLGIDAYTGGVAQGSSSVASATSGTAKMASAQTLNSTNFSFNGVLKTLDTAWAPPTVTRLRLDGGGINNASKWFKTVKYYPARASDTQLQLLTQ